MLSWHAQGKFYFYLYIIKNSIFAITAWISVLTSNIKKWQVKVKQSWYRPGVAQRVPGSKVPRFHDNGTGWW
jgi:hypothetical protein